MCEKATQSATTGSSPALPGSYLHSYRAEPLSDKHRLSTSHFHFLFPPPNTTPTTPHPHPFCLLKSLLLPGLDQMLPLSLHKAPNHKGFLTLGIHRALYACLSPGMGYASMLKVSTPVIIFKARDVSSSPITCTTRQPKKAGTSYLFFIPESSVPLWGVDLYPFLLVCAIQSKEAENTSAKSTGFLSHPTHQQDSAK